MNTSFFRSSLVMVMGVLLGTFVVRFPMRAQGAELMNITDSGSKSRLSRPSIFRLLFCLFMVAVALISSPLVAMAQCQPTNPISAIEEGDPQHQEGGIDLSSLELRYISDTKLQ